MVLAGPLGQAALESPVAGLGRVLVRASTDDGGEEDAATVGEEAGGLVS